MEPENNFNQNNVVSSGPELAMEEPIVPPESTVTDSTTPESIIAESTTPEPAVATTPTMSEPATMDSTTSEPTISEPTMPNSVTSEPERSESASAISESTTPSEPTFSEPASEPKAKKPRKPLIIIIIVVLLILITGGIILGLGAAGIINLGFIGTPTPSAAAAESTCTKYGGVYSVEEDEYVPSSLKDNLVAVYSCDLNSDNSDSSSDKVSFVLYEFNEDTLKLQYFQDEIGNPAALPAVGVLEDSDSYFKIAIRRSIDRVSYSVLYKKFYGIVNATSIELAENVLVSLGFPDRNRATTAAYEAEVNAVNEYNQAIIDKVAATLVEYQASHDGALPVVTPDENSIRQSNIDGTGNTALDEFYKTLGELTKYSGGQYLVDVLDPNINASAGWYDNNGNILIKYGYYCVKFDNGEAYTQRGDSDTAFAITLNSASGGSLCAGSQGENNIIENIIINGGTVNDVVVEDTENNTPDDAQNSTEGQTE